MRNKILFIVPPNVPMSGMISAGGQTFSAKIRAEIPLGVLCLSAYVKKYSHVEEICILDFNIILRDFMQNNIITGTSEIIVLIQKTMEAYTHYKSDFIGISAIFSNSYEYLPIIGGYARKYFPNALIAAGGGIPTNLPIEVFCSVPEIDVIFYGEGEIALSGLLNAYNEEEYINHAPSIITRRKLKENEKANFQFVENLDDIPLLDFSLLDFQKYIMHYHSQDDKKITAIPLMFSRGCPFRCSFCSAHSVHGRIVRYHSLRRIKEDIRKYKEYYDVNTISIFDDNFFVQKDIAIECLNYFESLGMNIEFVNGFPVYRADDEMAERLSQAGVEVVTLAIESGCRRVLRDIIHKPLHLDMVPNAIECLQRHGLYVKGLFVIGFPGETLMDIQETMQFIHESKLNWVDIYIATPLPGSELLDICLAKGYLKDKVSVLDTNFWRGGIQTECFDAKTIEEIQQYNTIKKDYVNNMDMVMGNWERAYHNFQYVIDGNHENPFSYYYAAKALEKMKNFALARRYYKRFCEIIKNNISWYNLYEKFSSEGIDFSINMNL